MRCIALRTRHGTGYFLVQLDMCSQSGATSFSDGTNLLSGFSCENKLNRAPPGEQTEIKNNWTLFQFHLISPRSMRIGKPRAKSNLDCFWVIAIALRCHGVPGIFQ